MYYLEQIVNQIYTTPSDINEHIPTLIDYASECEHITEMGVRAITSTWAFLGAAPKKLISYDIENPKHYGANIDVVYEVAKHTNVSGVAIASLFHYEAINYFPKLKTKIGNTIFLDNFKKSYKKRNIILELKKYLDSKGVLVRL